MSSTSHSQCITFSRNFYKTLQEYYFDEKQYEFETFSLFFNRTLENYRSEIKEQILMYDSLIAMRAQDFHQRFFDRENPFESFAAYSSRVSVHLSMQNFELLKQLAVSACLPIEVISDFYGKRICSEIYFSENF